ncbi:MAG: hypothetical protein IKI01_06935 [Lachnospiraceae bacterium]|nr:hypothetical protein [Lachnospiraceae bacterium]
MNAAEVLPHLPVGEVFNKSTFRRTVRSVYPDCPETSVNWMLVTLRRQGRLASAGAGKYYRTPQDTPARKQYSYPHSPEYLALEKEITEAYPLVHFQMWELIQMNDFVNHQIAKNVIFVEAEAMLVDTVYELLHGKHPYAMVQPTYDAFYKQRAPETDIVVQKLLSEAPSPDANHSCVMEKLLVDLLSKKLSGSLIERSEYPRIYEDVFRKYNIDETRMFRYAKRRHLYESLLSFIKTKTDIKLMTI